jgi:hypothetical protein
MELLSTKIVGGSIELTFADDPQTDAATKLLQARLPREVDPTKSIAWHRYWFLREVRDELDAMIEQERKIAEGR